MSEKWIVEEMYFKEIIKIENHTLNQLIKINNQSIFYFCEKLRFEIYDFFSFHILLNERSNMLDDRLKF